MTPTTVAHLVQHQGPVVQRMDSHFIHWIMDHQTVDCGLKSQALLVSVSLFSRKYFKVKLQIEVKN